MNAPSWATRAATCAGCGLPVAPGLLLGDPVFLEEDQTVHTEERCAAQRRETAASWRNRHLAKIRGDRTLVLWIRPTDAGGQWLAITKADDIIDHLIEGEADEQWDLKWSLMTEKEIEALPEHEGW